MNLLQKATSSLSPLENGAWQARWLLCHRLGCTFSELLANNVQPTKEQERQIEQDIKKLQGGYPLQYLLGTTEFMGLEFLVREQVLIPRNDTEILAQKVIDDIGDMKCKVLDLCCGSGCIGISVAHYCENAMVTCADISSDAIALTKDNAKKLGAAITVIQSDLIKSIPGEFDILVSNPPYIESEELKKLPEQVQFEPELALDGKQDGLHFYREIAKQARGKIQNKLYFEIGYNQGKAVSGLLKDGEIVRDYHGLDRVVLGEIIDV